MLDRDIFLLHLVSACAPVEGIPLQLEAGGEYVLRQNLGVDRFQIVNGCAHVRDIFSLGQPAIIAGAAHVCLSFFYLGPLRERLCPRRLQIHLGGRYGRHRLGAKGNVDIASEELVQMFLLRNQRVAQLDELIP